MNSFDAAREGSRVRHDMEAIRQLRRRYALSTGTGNLDGLDEVFSSEARVTDPRRTVSGLTAIKRGLEEMYGRATRSGPTDLPFRHGVLSHDVDVACDGTATGRCYFIEYDVVSPDGDPILSPRVFHDKYEMFDGQWRITRTIVELARF